MKINAYKCDACKAIFEPTVAHEPVLGVRVILGYRQEYESLSEPPEWRYAHVCEKCRAALNNFLHEQGWTPTREADADFQEVPPAPPSRAAKEPF